MAFPSRGLIFKDRLDKIRDTISRPSLDTYYQVDFSFGKESTTWLKENQPGKRRTQGTNFKRKMSLLCTQAEIPGTSFIETTATGHYQGIQESFPNLRNFAPLNLVFYVDADHVVLEVLERWMTYINPIPEQFVGSRDSAAFTRFNYPDDYKETIHITKFEKDTFIPRSRGRGDSGTDASGLDFDDPNAFRQGLVREISYQSNMSSYEFINVWPSNLTSMRVAYGDSNVLRCTIQFAYDRFITKFNYPDTRPQVLRRPDGESKDAILNRFK